MLRYFRPLFLFLVVFLVGCSTGSGHKDKGTILIKDTTFRCAYLFHGSPDRSIKIFEPRAIHVRSKDEGPVVFATPYIQNAAIFLNRWSDDWATSGSFASGNKSVFYFICSDKERFLKEDNGGAIYVLPSENFVCNRYSKWHPHSEWTSSVPVRPFHKFEFAKTFDAMMNLGVQVFFVDVETYKKFMQSGRLATLKTLVSENQKTQTNYISLDEFEN